IDKVCDVLTRLLDFNFSSAVVATETDGVLTATIDLDNIVKQLGYQTGALGTVEAVINRNSHAMKTSGKTLVTDADGNTQLKEWISLSSELAPRRDYSSFARADYISIEFLPTLIDDLVKFATDDEGNLHDKFTLSGTVTASVLGRFDINIDICTMTVGLDENNGLTLSAIMHVKKVSVIGLVTIPESTVGITYQNGLLTLARGVNTSSPEYKVMTFDYFIDHMLVKNGSVLQWLLNIDGWNTLMSVVNLAAGDLNISSGLTTTEDVYLYKASVSKDEQEISMYDYVDAINVIINGVKTASFGNSIDDLENTLGVTDNYYGFALNAGAVTGGTLSKLYAALVRTDDGISGVKAAGAVSSYVTFKADLQYKEDWTEEYELGTALGEGVTAVSMYDKALGAANANGYAVDFDHYVKKPESGYDEIFGCMSITGGSNGYTFATDYSQVLYTHVLTVVGLDGSVETRDVRHGSTVYFYDNYSPVYTDSGKSMRLLYSLSDSEVGAASAVMNGDITVYALQRKSVTVVVHNGDETVEISSFAGDRVPVTVNGLETLSAPEYSDGTPVGENDIISGEQAVIHIYGTFVKTETVVNYVRYVFDAQTRSYTAAGKAAGFNDYYSVKGNVLSLENQIGGYPVTAIAAGAFANTEEKPIVSVIVPSNITTVGQEAFKDNYGMKRAVFLAETVKFEGSDGSAQTMPFSGCSRSSSDEKVGGVKQNEVTDLVVYYNNITTNGGNWRHFRYVKVIASYNFYIGNNGGATYGAGEWQYVDYDVTVDLGGVVGSTLSEQAVRDVLAPYFPDFRTSEFVGSVEEAEIERKLETALTQFEILRGGVVYACVVTTDYEKDGCYEKITYNVSYRATATVNVISAYAFTYNGVAVGANT
ncbi:MAG: leucine-rich repeat domain-containing protein, partial [Clostridia bacterium]|nr:leucine-rich repeat domain-containing protein [Clostridia bacterium]